MEVDRNGENCDLKLSRLCCISNVTLLEVGRLEQLSAKSQDGATDIRNMPHTAK